MGETDLDETPAVDFGFDGIDVSELSKIINNRDYFVERGARGSVITYTTSERRRIIVPSYIKLS